MLSKITITQFKNYEGKGFNFTERLVAICGANGKGKTNLLDAIYYMCFTKSYFTNTDALNIQYNKDGFRLESTIDNDNLICIFREKAKKEFYLNQIVYPKLSAHIGKYPAVMIAPDDIIVITGGSEERRRYIDILLSQMDATYLQQLVVYNKVLQQRNSLLKTFAETGKTDWQLLDVMDEQLIQPGTYIYTKRRDLMEDLIPLVQQFYQQISKSNEVVTLNYESQLNNQDFYNLLNNYRQKDFALQRSSGGIHKDDITFELNNYPFKNSASQGQRKSLLFALKFTETTILKKHKGNTPILLLDDAFEKLDEQRMKELLHWVCIENNGQVFITDTHKQRLVTSLEPFGIPYQIIELN